LFYSISNLGFVSKSSAQINRDLWIGSCIKLNSLVELSNRIIIKQNNELENNYNSFNTSLFPDSTDEIKKNDSLNVPIDSTLNIVKNKKIDEDSLRLYQMSIDSTARLENFKYKLKESPIVELQTKKTSSLLLRPSSIYRTRTVEIDSLGQFVIIKEFVYGIQTKIVLKIPIGEYLALQLKENNKTEWEKLVDVYKFKSSIKELGQLITDITNFEIPLPSVGVLSIFGPPKIGLKIGGAVDIHGAFKSETTEGVTASLLGNTRSEPDFKQQVQINVKGTIGDKLDINADWNTERTFQYENQLKIKYTGYPDEIIQSIEAGNVAIQTSPLVGGSEALFGLKAEFKLGPFSLTTIASQKKGQIKTVNVTGGSTSSEFNLRAYDYSQNHYFLDTLYASQNSNLNLFFNYYGQPTPLINPQYRVNNIEVWRSVTGVAVDQSKERIANTYINLNALSAGQRYPDNLRGDIAAVPGQTETGRFLLLTEGVDYILHPETGYMTFNTQIQDNDIIAVAYRVENGASTTDDLFYGEFLNSVGADTTAKLVLKLVKPRNLQPGGNFAEAWKLQLKNIYPVGGRNIKKEGFEFKIRYEIDGQDPVSELSTPAGPVKLLNTFGFDFIDQSNNPNPDDIFDYRPGITIFPGTGEIVFPSLEPFGENLNNAIPDSLSYQLVYDTTKTFARQNNLKDKWLLQGKFSGDVTSVYQLGFNVVENSVRVTLDGRELVNNVDYNVDYTIGQLSIRNDAALVPGANLSITYEQNDLFQLASKTLLGARGIFNISERSKIGFTVLNLNQQTLSEKVRIGEEPLSNTIYGIDFTTSTDLPFLTKVLDKIISTREMSTFSVSGEYAYMKPDPNTKKSVISDDNGKSIAYIDDFEGAKRIIPIGINYTGWKDLSVPDKLISLSGLTKLELMNYKGKSFWFSVIPSDVNVRDIWGDKKQVARANEQVSVLDYVFLPDTPGTYNYTPNLVDKNKNWGGIMRLLSTTANNLVEENIEFIEFWMNASDSPIDAKIYIDLGRISEDVIPNNKLDTEDKNFNDVIDPNGNEDTGIDGILDAEEKTLFGSTKSDPSGDNFSFTQTNTGNIFDYFNINGTQGNAILTDVGRIPDTEDLNRNGNLDQVNSYFRYAVPLDTTSTVIAGSGAGKGWYLYRIPLKDSLLKVGDPSLSSVETIRVVVTGSTNPVHIRVAEFNLVGNQWQKLLPEDSVMSVSVINIEDNPNYFSPAQGLRVKDQTRPDENILSNEQSLNLILNNLPEGENRQAVKYLTRPLDVFNYTSMKLFIHGDENSGPGSISSTDPTDYPAEVFFRFGSDTNNFYEYRQPIRPGWNDISIIFDELTAIKEARDSINQFVQIPVNGKPDDFYLVRGIPTLTSIRFLTVGVFNRGNPLTPGPVSGEVWVDELRVIGADDRPGWAYSISSNLKMADFMSINFNISESSPFFHRLADRFGTRIQQRNWGISSNIDLLKILPFNLPGSNFKLNYSHTESLGKPEYIPGTDVSVSRAAALLAQKANDSTTANLRTPEQIREESETFNTSDNWSATNINFKIPSSKWYIIDIINAVSFGFTYNKTFGRSPTIQENKSWLWNANMNYNLRLGPDYYFQPVNIPLLGSVISIFKDYKDVKVYFVPQSFSLNITARRNRNTSIQRPIGNNPVSPIVSRDFITTRGFNFDWKMTEGGLLNLTTNYKLDIQSSLTHLETDALGNQRPESEIWKDIFSGSFFGQDFLYQQSINIRAVPQIPSLWDIKKYLTITAGYSVNYQWLNDFRQPILGRSAGVSNNTNISFNLRWKALTEPLFSSKPDDKVKESTPTQRISRGRNRILKPLSEEKTDTVKNKLIDIDNDIVRVDSIKTNEILEPQESTLSKGLLFLRSVAKSLLFDYETITLNFNMTNNFSKNGLAGTGSGFKNFWGFSFKENNGPSQGFMLGLNDNVGRRAPNSDLQDVFAQKNNFEIRTSRPLWSGAKLDLNWSVGWTINKTTTLKSDQFGNTSISFISSTGTINRTFLSFPPVLFLKSFNTGIKKVHELFDPNDPNPAKNLSDAFIKGFESLPLASNLGFLNEVAKFIPRPNWRITWAGLEKLPLFKSLMQRVTLDHAYNSSYAEGWKITPDGNQETQIQKVQYGFTPLLGLNMTFMNLWNGNLIGSIKYSTSTIFSLGVSTRNIIETFSKDIGITAGYSKSGFELPLFGVALKNDIEFTISYTKTRNSTIIYNMLDFKENGTPQDGTSRVTIEPRVKYTLSSKVTMSIFYRRSSIEPEGASRIPPSTTNEAGLDVHIAIQ